MAARRPIIGTLYMPGIEFPVRAGDDGKYVINAAGCSCPGFINWGSTSGPCKHVKELALQQSLTIDNTRSICSKKIFFYVSK